MLKFGLLQDGYYVCGMRYEQLFYWLMDLYWSYCTDAVSGTELFQERNRFMY